MSAPKRARRNPRCASRGDSDSHGDDGNRIAGVAGVTDGNRHPHLSRHPFPHTVILERYIFSVRSTAKKIIAFGDLFPYGVRCQRSPNRLPVAMLRMDGQCRSRMTAKGEVSDGNQRQATVTVTNGNRIADGDGNRIAGVAGVTDGNRHPLLQPSSISSYRHPRTIYFLHARAPLRSPSFSNDIFRPRVAWLRNNRIRESPSGWHRAKLTRFPNAAILRVSSLIRALRVTLTLTKNRSGRFFLIVLKHEGNMPFENDGGVGLPVTTLRAHAKSKH